MTESTPTNPSDAAASGIHVDSDWKAQAEAERARQVIKCKATEDVIHH